MTIEYKYLRVWFDYRSTGIFATDEPGYPVRNAYPIKGVISPIASFYPVKRDTLELPQEIWDSIDVLLDKYAVITLSSPAEGYGTIEERLRVLDTVLELDIAGTNVARDIQDVVGEDVVVEYFSEGLIQNIPFTRNASSLTEMLEEKRARILSRE